MKGMVSHSSILACGIPRTEEPGGLWSCDVCTVLSQSGVFNSLQLQGLQSTRLRCPWGFSRQEYWSGLPCPPPEDLLNPGTEPRSPAVHADSLPSGSLRKPMGYDPWDGKAPDVTEQLTH